MRAGDVFEEGDVEGEDVAAAEVNCVDEVDIFDSLCVAVAVPPPEPDIVVVIVGNVTNGTVDSGVIPDGIAFAL